MSETVDLTKIRVGDLVTVRLHVTGINDHDVWLATKPGAGAIMDAPVECIVSHTPKALAVGDRVKPRDSVTGGEIVAISGPYAWVMDASGSHWTEDLAQLEPSNA